MDGSPCGIFDHRQVDENRYFDAFDLSYVHDCYIDRNADDGPRWNGDFDVLMILGMSQLPVRQDVAVVWLLYYRLFYYVLPL